MTPEPLMTLVREWPHDRCACGIHGQFSCHAANQLCPKCKRCQVEAALKSWAEHPELVAKLGFELAAWVREFVLGVEEK